MTKLLCWIALDCAGVPNEVAVVCTFMVFVKRTETLLSLWFINRLLDRSWPRMLDSQEKWNLLMTIINTLQIIYNFLINYSKNLDDIVLCFTKHLLYMIILFQTNYLQWPMHNKMVCYEEFTESINQKCKTLKVSYCNVFI